MNGHKIPYSRVLLKISGEALMGKQSHGIASEACLNIVNGIKSLTETGVEVAIVIGGGNIFRGICGTKLEIPRCTADQMGMLATIINGLALAETIKNQNLEAVVMSAINCSPLVEQYNWQRANTLLNQNKILIFVGGINNPYFTTDTAAAVRAAEINAQALLKATKVDGIYSKDPLQHSDATRYTTLSYEEVLTQKLNVMDATAITLCRENDIPIFVFNMQNIATLPQVLQSEKLRTLVH